MPNTKRDKYDEKALEIAILFGTDNGGIESDALIKLASILRSAFPPPAEDARQLVDHLLDSRGLVVVLGGGQAAPTMNEQFRRDWAAGISRFAESRVEPWREALKTSRDQIESLGLSFQSHGIMEHYDRALRCMADIDALLSDSPAKEAH